jgi:O-antigen ligase
VRSHGLALATLLLAGALCFLTFYPKGGLNLETMSTTEMALTLSCAVVLAATILLGPARVRRYGVWPTGLLLMFAVLSALSVAWSVQPDESWRDSGRLFAYAAVFAAAVMVARIAPRYWRALLGAVTLASLIACVFALLTKCFPGDLVPYTVYARLEQPYSYWNALGLTAGLGVICCLWLAARRSGHALLGTLAYPAMGILLLTLLLAYSRGALGALAVGVVLWFGLVPLRLRGAAVLIAGALAAGGVAAYAFSTHALSAEHVVLAEQARAGHRLAALVVVMVVLLTIVGLAVRFSTARRAPTLRLRRRAGAALLALIVLALIVLAAALAHSHRGFTGSISHAFHTVTDPNAKPPKNTPSRLTAVASVRARYWKEALQIFSAHPAAGTGAATYQIARMRYRDETLEVRHAHGFVVQTLADLGLAGLAVALALLLTWMAAAGRATHPFNRSWSSWRTWRTLRSGPRPAWRAVRAPYTAERVGMLNMLCLVAVFGVHSFADWTWYVPFDACAALMCAGWLAGRGPLRAAEPSRSAQGAIAPRSARRPLPSALRGLGQARLPAAAAVLVAALLAAWSQWQPQRAEEARTHALTLLANNRPAASDAAQTAVSRDPLSAEALITLAYVQSTSGHSALARATLQRAVRLQPSNPQTWLALGRADLGSHPRAALHEFEAAIYLNPESIAPEALAEERPAVETYNDYVSAYRAVEARTRARQVLARRKREAARHGRAARGRRSRPGR